MQTSITRKKRKKSAGVFLLLLLLAVFLLPVIPPSASAEGTGLEDIALQEVGHWTCRFDGVAHDFIVDLPENPEGAPLVLMLHGYGQTAESFRLATGFEKDAVPEGYAVVYVTGAPNPNDRTSSTCWNSGYVDSPNRDVEFLTALSAYLQQEYGLDSSRTFAAGFSNGAFMTHRLALEANDIFSAVVSVAGMMPEGVWNARPAECRVGLLQITGEKDEVVPKNSDGSARYSKAPAIEEVVEYYAAANGLTEEESLELGKASLLTEYSGKDPGPQVWHLVVKNGHHSWSAEQFTGINTNRLILQFLETLA